MFTEGTLSCLLYISDIPENQLNQAHMSAHDVSESSCTTVHKSDTSNCSRCSVLAPELTDEILLQKLEISGNPQPPQPGVRKCVVDNSEPYHMLGLQ
jgi:hypothetical protein